MSRQLKEVSARSYIATAAFHLNFFTYKTSMNSQTFKTTGDLSKVTGATSGTCPAGRILRENGKKLFPGAHPIDTVNGVTTTFPPSTVMVGVFDNQSGLNGFIDVNAPVFAVYNGDRPNYLKDAVDPVGGLTDHSAPTLTNGSVNILEDLNVTGNSALTGTLSVTDASTLKGGVKVAASGTLITRILKGSNLSTTSSLPGPSHAGNYNIGDVYDLAFTVTGVTVNDTVIANPVANFAGWIVAAAWPVTNGFILKVFATGTHTNNTVPAFNYTIIQS
uniref:Uncharacterized protein n=1 Tax=viral metagenome TaxID=1070528 RepID=A0A6C0AMS2_9ZZZZ